MHEIFIDPYICYEFGIISVVKNSSGLKTIFSVRNQQLSQAIKWSIVHRWIEFTNLLNLSIVIYELRCASSIIAVTMQPFM